MRTIYLDTETTGLSPPTDALVEIAIVDDDGEVLIDELVNPGRLIGPASAIHGITDDMVRDRPPVDLLLPQVERIVRGAHLVIYNASFDTRFFPDGLRSAARISCAMQRFSNVYGDRELGRRTGRNHRWQKLTTAASYIGYDWDGEAHRALADARAARAVWRWLEREAAREAA